MREDMHILESEVDLLYRNLKTIRKYTINPTVKARATQCLKVLDEVIDRSVSL